MFSKRKFLTLVSALSLSALAGLSPAWAAGGNDPITGIDIIIKKNPGSQPITSVPFGNGELAKLNALRGAERPNFVLKVVAARMGAGDGFVKSGMAELGKIWCGPCKMADRIEVKFRDEKVNYALSLTFRAEEATRPTKRQGKVNTIPKLDKPKS